MKSDDSKGTPPNMADRRSCKSVDSGYAPSLPSSRPTGSHTEIRILTMEWTHRTQGVHSGKQAQRSTGSSAPSMRSDDSKDTPPNMADRRRRLVASLDSISCKSVDSGYAPSLSSSSVCSGSVLCDVCSDPAVKKCLTCMASYCMTHVKDHYTSPDLTRHQLLERKPSKSFMKEGSADAPPPGQIQFDSVQPDSVSLRWSPPEGAPGPHSFKVTWTGAQKHRSLEVTGETLEVTELTPGERYHFTVATLSQDGRQSTCVEGTVYTEVPAPQNLQVDLRFPTASLTWTKPAGVDQVTYLLEICRDKKQIRTIHRDSSHYAITDLQRAADYTISVSTVLSNGRQSKPTSKTFRTEVPPPQNLQVDLRFSTASVTWTKPAGVDQVTYLLEIFRDQEQICTIHRDSCSYTITDLQPLADYTIRVTTVLSNGRQSKPASKTFRTGLTALSICLLGETGSGKSASGNTILGSNEFPSKTSEAPVTTRCQSASTYIRGTEVKVIDTPDFFDEDLEQPSRHVIECRQMCEGGLCVYLLVIQLGRFTEGERDILERLEKALPPRIRHRAIILFTHGDDLDQHIDDYVRNTNTHLQKLIRKCGDRYHVFNNRNKYEAANQKEVLMRKIAKLVQKSSSLNLTPK